MKITKIEKSKGRRRCNYCQSIIKKDTICLSIKDEYIIPPIKDEEGFPRHLTKFRSIGIVNICKHCIELLNYELKINKLSKPSYVEKEYINIKRRSQMGETNYGLLLSLALLGSFVIFLIFIIWSIN